MVKNRFSMAVRCFGELGFGRITRLCGFRLEAALERRCLVRKIWLLLASLLAVSLTGCGYNTIQTQDEQVKASWSEVVNQYQRRAGRGAKSGEHREGLRQP